MKRNFARLVRPLPLYLGVGLSAVVTIISVPLMIAQAGLVEWSAIGIGQTIGAAVAPAVGLGWAITGPHAVARANVAHRPTIFAEAMTSRFVAAVPALLLGVVLSAALVDTHHVPAAIIGMAATALVSADAAFYFLGLGREWAVFLVTALPRVLGTALGALLVWLYHVPIVTVPLGTLVGLLVGIGIAAWLIRAERQRWQADEVATARPRRSTGAVLRSQWASTVSSIVGGVYLLAPTAVVRLVAPGVLPDFVFYDKLVRQLTTFVGPLMNFLQGWVPRGASLAERRRRVRASLLFSAALSAVLTALLLLFGSWFVHVMSAGESEPTLGLSAALAVNIVVWIVDVWVLRIYLVDAGRMRAAALSSVIGGVIGVGLVAVAAPILGAVGALAAAGMGIAVRAGAAVLLIRSR